MNSILGVVGQLIDQESVFMFKQFFNKLGISNLYLQEHNNLLTSNINLDFRSNYILNTRLYNLDINATTVETINKEITGTTSSDFILLVGTNPRYDASLLNVRLRQLLIKKNITIASIGSPMNLTYEHNHLGNSVNTLFQLVNGLHP